MGELEPFEQAVPTYDLTDWTTHQLTLELIKERLSDAPAEDRFMTVEIAPGDAYSNIARHIEAPVFDEAFENDAAKMAEIYGPYEAASRFFVSIDREKGMPTGALRVIENSTAGFMTLNDVQGEEFGLDLGHIRSTHHMDDLDKVWDVGTVAVAPEHRDAQGAVSVQLYRAMYVSARDHHIRHLISIIDDRPYRKLKKFLGIPFVPLDGVAPKPYLGSDKSHPVYGYVPEFYPKMRWHMQNKIRGRMARPALERLVNGTEDHKIDFDSR
jgi:hypothetical protein